MRHGDSRRRQCGPESLVLPSATGVKVNSVWGSGLGCHVVYSSVPSVL